MKVKDIMTQEVQACTPETNLAEVTARMWKGDCGVVPVIDSDRVIGIITDRDIAIALGSRNLPASDVPVQEVMTREVSVCTAEDDLQKALQIMQSRMVRRLPVVDSQGRLEGILSLNDVILGSQKAGGRQRSDIPVEAVVDTLKGVSEHRQPSATGEAHQTAAR